jgi:pSer/pThr/pTyr-binding forkhead associated (FHA) protein
MEDQNDKTILGEGTKKLKAAGFLGKRGLLIVLSPNYFGKTYVLGDKEVVVGRHADCDLVIADPLLSRKHCSITIDEEGDFCIEDRGSTNFTFLNSRKLEGKSKLHYGDRIVMGDTILRFYLEEEIEKKQGRKEQPYG